MFTREIDWILLSEPPVLESDDIHIWRIDTLDLLGQIPNLTRLLSPDELERTARFRFEKDRDRFINVRGVLRMLLGLYINERPEKLRFKYNDNGRPSLEMRPHTTSLHFNVSVSRNIAVIAVTFNERIGIDIEFIDTEFPKFDVADRYFSVDEVSALRGLPAESQTEAFFNCWTIKEAYVKALGEGLSRPMPKVRISSDLHDANAVQIHADLKEAEGWFISNFIPKPSYVATFAYDGSPGTVRYLKWL